MERRNPDQVRDSIFALLKDSLASRNRASGAKLFNTDYAMTLELFLVHLQELDHDRQIQGIRRL